MASRYKIGHTVEENRPVSNKVSALLLPWRHPGTSAPTKLPRFIAIGHNVAVLSDVGRGPLTCNMEI